MQRLHHRPEARIARSAARSRPPPPPGSAVASQSEHPVRVGVGDEPLDRRVADAAPRPVCDAQQRDRVVGVVEHLRDRRRVLDLGPLVEARPADHLVAERPDGRARPRARGTARSSGRRPPSPRRTCPTRRAWRSPRRRSGPRRARPRPPPPRRDRRRRAPTRAASACGRGCCRSPRSRRRGSCWSSGSSAPARSRARRGSRARSRGCCGCPRRGTRRSSCG